MAHRIVNAENNFLAVVKTAASCTQAEAEKVLRVYRKLKLVKMDAVGGVLSVKHGAYLDAEVLRNAINHAEKFNR